MPSVKNPSVLFISTPVGQLPIPGEHVVYRDDATIDLDAVPLNGGFLTKAVNLGIDPVVSGRMQMGQYQSGKPIAGWGIGVVLRSEHAGYKPGDHIYSTVYPFQHYTVFESDAKVEVLQDEGLPWSTYLGALGLAGETAWVGYKALAHAQKGETIYVSAASGAVGSIICQVAKLEGLKVIASAGSADKVEFLKKEIGVDVAFNYKTEDINAVLKQHGPVDIYWDNVGGATLEATLYHMKKWGRVLICGFAADWGKAVPYGIKSTRMILVNNITISGFILTTVTERYGDFDFRASVKKLIKEGKLKVKEQVFTDLADVPQVLFDHLNGDAFGKPILKLA